MACRAAPDHAGRVDQARLAALDTMDPARHRRRDVPRDLAGDPRRAPSLRPVVPGFRSRPTSPWPASPSGHSPSACSAFWPSAASTARGRSARPWRAMPRRGVLLTRQGRRRRPGHPGRRRSAELPLVLRGSGRALGRRADGDARPAGRAAGGRPLRGLPGPLRAARAGHRHGDPAHGRRHRGLRRDARSWCPSCSTPSRESIARFAPELIFANSVAAVVPQGDAVVGHNRGRAHGRLLRRRARLGAVLLHRRDA